MTLLHADVVSPRVVPLGESDGLTVRRTLPTARRALVGPWCFVDHFGPDDVHAGGMQVPAHPHTCLQTVSWLFEGAIEHRDSTGGHAVVQPGTVAVMTAGRGIAHSERSVGAGVLRGLQLWAALPQDARLTAPSFATTIIEATPLAPGVSGRVFAGTLAGIASGSAAHGAIVGAELVLEPGASARIPLTDAYDYAVLLEDGDARVDGRRIDEAHLALLAPGASTLQVGTDRGARIVILGGAPMTDPIVMWWNLVGSSHEEIAAFRAQWEAELDGTASTTVFGLPVGDVDDPLHAPPLPSVRLKPRNG